MPSQDLIFPILPRPQGRVTRDEKTKVRKASEHQGLSTSEHEHKEPTAEALDRVVKAMEQQEMERMERQLHPKTTSKQLEQLQEVEEQKDEDDNPHLDIEA